MKASTYQQIQELSRLTVGQLRDKHLEVFGEESRCHHKAALQKRIAWRLQALAEGGLSERARRRAEELANDADLRMRAPRDPIRAGTGAIRLCRPSPRKSRAANGTGSCSSASPVVTHSRAGVTIRG